MGDLTCAPIQYGRLCWCLLLTTLLLLSTNIRTVSSYDLVHVDVSGEFYYQELLSRHEIVTDQKFSISLLRRQDVNSTSDNNGTVPVPVPGPTSLNTATGLPIPFDSLGSNFTSSSCPNYFDQFLSDSTFQSCLPISLLLQNSMSFFQAIRSLPLLQKTLDASCSASLAVCSPLMDKLASGLSDPSKCQTDFQNQNPVVLQAYAGLKAYEVLYQATCLKSPTTNQYCFYEAMESSNADDSYPYYTAIGLQLPPTAQPQCSDCLKQTMTIFAKYATQKDQPIANTYMECATQIDSHCGPSFADTQVKTASKVTNGAPSLLTPQSRAVAMALVGMCLFNIM